MSYEEILKEKVIAVDTETSGLNYHGAFQDYNFYPARPFAFSFTGLEGNEWYASFPVDCYTRRVMYEKDPETFYKLVYFFSLDGHSLVMHNANFDYSIISRCGIIISGRIIDTMIMLHAFNSKFPLGLKPICKKLFDVGEEDQEDLLKSVNKARRIGKQKGYCIATEEKGFGKSPNKADYWLGDPALVERYALGDTRRTLGLWLGLNDEYKNNKAYRELVRVEEEVRRIIMYMQDKGIRIDENKVKELKQYYNTILKEQNNVKCNLGFKDLNENSPAQLKKIFYDKYKCDPIYRLRKKKDGEKEETVTTDSEALKIWSKKIPLAKCLIEISAAQHQLNTFINPFSEIAIRTSQGRILRPSYRSVGPVTGRVSCSKPNLLNLSSKDSIKRVSETEYRTRECFIPRDDYVLYFLDYKQIELWIAAFLSQDEIMMKYLVEKKDLHLKTALACFQYYADYEERKTMYRRKGKTVNFETQYGVGAKRLAEELEVSYEEAYKALEDYWTTYNGLANYKEQLGNKMRNDGHIINPFFRKYYGDKNTAYKALSLMVQGSAAEVMKRAMINVFDHIKYKDIYILLTIYDELVIEASNKVRHNDVLKMLVACMQADFHQKFNMPVPFPVDVSYTVTNWGEKKEYKL